MRLHSLQVTAFGPFAGTESVDFDALGADGLFLLHGPTGAGKTTVLDAVAFALFGKLPGARQDADGRRLRSDHAADGASPRVELELSVSGRRARIVRSPEHQRPKKKGSGTTREQARASLTWLDASGSEGISRPDEVGREVERLLGMSADQFFQVVLLPQGAFATFLRADTADRATLLERLFDTARFADAEEWLAERRRSTAAAVVEGTQDVQVLLARAGTAAGGADAVAAASSAPAVDEALPWVEELAAVAEASRLRAEAARDAAAEAATAAAAALTGARDRAGLVLRRDAARQQLAGWAQGEPERAVAAGAVLAAGRAQPVAAAAHDAGEARVGAERAEHEVAELAELLAADPDGAAALARPGGPSPAAEGGLFELCAPGEVDALFDLPAGPDLASVCEGWRTEVGALAGLVDLAARTAVDDRHASELHARAADLDTRLASLAERRRELPVEREVADAALAAARRAAESLDDLADALARSRAVADGAEQVGPLERAHAGAEQERSGAVAVQQGAKEHWLDLRERRLQGMAAELAGALAEGDCCAVCGSREHPCPAAPIPHAVSSADEQRAHELEQRAALAVQAATERTATALRELDAARQRAAGLDLVAARAAVDTAAAAHARALAVSGMLPAARARCAALATDADTLAQQELVLHQELAATRAEEAALRAQVTAARARLELGRGTDPDVYSRLHRLDALATTGAKLVAARTAAASSRRHADDRARRAARLAEEAGFGGVEQALRAVLPPARVATLQGVLDDARDTEVRVRAVLAEPDVEALGDLDAERVRAELRLAQDAAAQAEAALGAAQGAAATARQRASAVGGVLRELRARLDALGPVLREAADVAALADVVAGRGQNARKVSLHSYVLAARLEEVAVAASLRLRRMSGGRYEFVHTDAVGPNGKRGGLGLDVLDDHTGALRSTKTLSGGESFLASLSLALGLADVVAEESGGVQLDTLFIDEGFGTLDPATLEEVMAVLDELRAGGRVVGLVSHVDELRQRIPNRLHVIATRTGSHLAASTG